MVLEKRDRKPSAIGLVSGGLDSALAARLMTDLDVQVTLLHLKHVFQHRPKGPSLTELLADSLNLPLIEQEISDELLSAVCAPRFGHGKNLNPCIDCHVLMLKRARVEMQRLGADFLFTGEVLGQRPMSQHRGSLNQVEKQAGVKGILLRPLSAKLMEPTLMEESGLVDRERLLDLSGRSRSRQLALAAEWGVKHFGTPAGGCLLTDPEFTRRLQKTLERGCPSVENADLLRFGRHFQLDDTTKAVVGRDSADNDAIENRAMQGDIFLFSESPPGPLVLLRGNASEDNLRLAALLQKRYGKARDEDTLCVSYRRMDSDQISRFDAVGSLSEEFLDEIRI